MGRFTGVLVLLLAAAITLAACGGSGQGGGDQSNPPGTTENASSTRTLPEPGPLSAGRFRTEKFEPAFSFTVGEGWELPVPEFEETIFVYQGEDHYLTISNPQKVFDPKRPAEEKEIPAPDTVHGWIAWHRENPYLDVSDTRPASVGGATGVRFDLEVASAPEKATEICGAPCVPGYPVGPTAVDFFLGDDEQDYVLEVGDEIVVISAGAPAGEFDEFLPNAQKVLDTVEWEAQP